jgi:DNA-binding response OmpR family regulator
MSVGTHPHPLQFRDVSFDAGQRTLVVKGERLLLDGRSALVLQALIDRFGEIVSKDALLEAAWPGRLVHENSLARAISRLRSALGGSGLAINAAYGFGYSLGPAEDGACASQPPLAGMAAKRRMSPRAAMLAFLAAIVVATGPALFFGRLETASKATGKAFKLHDAPDAVATILWVDDHPANNEDEIAYFKQRRIAVHQAESTEDALKLLRMNDYRLVLSDLGRGDDRLAGLKLTALMKGNGIAKPLIIYTVRPKQPAGQRAQRQMVREAGADLAVTPAEVQRIVVGRLAAMLGKDPG